MDNLLLQCAMVIWIAGILFYCTLFYIATKKCFYGKCTVKKNICNVIVCILLMPMMVCEVSTELATSLIMEIFHIRTSSIEGYTILALCELVFIVIAVYLYIQYVKPKNTAIAIFVYLMVYVITSIPSSLPPMGKNSGGMQILVESLLILALGYFFYRFLIVPVSKIAELENKTGNKFYIVLPAFSLIYTIIIAGFNEVFGEENDLIYMITAISSIFVIAAICIGFNYIIRNIVVINKLEQARDDIKTLSVEVMEALAHTIDAKDEYTKGHSVRVANYSKMLAEKLGLSAEDCENIYYMGLLHDIGKIGVPNEIINKPTKLTTDEWNVIKLHPCLGFDILIEIKSRPDLSIGARWHHERYDGKGYPDRKAGDEIPFFARIIAVADSYDAMTSNRSYRKYLSQEVVRKEIEKNMGTQFDPKVAKCMIAIIDEDTEYTLHE